jgi:hypothetical protein
MAKYKSVLVGLRVVHAGRVRKCYHNKRHKIVKGDIVLEVRDDMNWMGYCAECGAEMLTIAVAEMTAFETALSSATDRP